MVMASAISFGLSPVFARMAYGEGVDVQGFLTARFILAFTAVGGYLAATRSIRPIPRRTMLSLVGLGAVGYFLQSSFYFTALLYMPVPVVALTLYTYPALVTAAALLLRWERASASLVGSLALALAGLALVVGPVRGGSIVGVGLALGAAVSYTCYILFGSKVLEEVEGEVATFYVMGAASVSFLLVGAAGGRLNFGWGEGGWSWVAITGLVSTAFAATAFFKGLKLVGPSKASIMSAMEPAASVAAAWVAFGEALSAWQWLGAAFILAASAWVARSRKAYPEA
jgi:drug/metabolite transporter (DMT)-like permease